MSNSTSCPDIDDYKCHDKGLLLPFVNEYTWPIAGRAIIYFLGLIWCFFGIAIIADVFMCAIEKITSRTRTVKVSNPDAPGGFEEINIRIWNGTVANLTLMALGSSAPEILLSCIEIIIKNNFKAGELGPGTIVGSAAFNLLVITAVCVVSIPSPEVKRLGDIKVFFVTASFGLFAYLWLIIILVGITPNYVDLGEAIMTLLFFPILVVLAYLVDKNFCGKKKPDKTVELGFEDSKHVAGRMNDKEMRDFLKELGKHPELSEEDAAKMAAAMITEKEPHDRLWYRINATRSMGGSSKLIPQLSESLKELYDNAKDREREGQMGSDVRMSSVDLSDHNKKAVVEFTATKCSVLENEQRVRVGIRRYGFMNNRVLFRVETVDGTAEAKSDYVAVKQVMVFEPNETYKYVDIEIVDDNQWEPDEVFFVKLSVEPDQNAMVGQKAINEITIVNDDEPGTLQFAKPSLLFKESAGKALIPIIRENGCDGRVSVSWKTEDVSARNQKDYEGGEGTITFEHGESTKTLEITIFDDQEMEKDECFRVELMEPTGGAKLGRVKKTIVTIVNDDDFNGMVSRLVNMTNLNMDSLRVDSNTYADQFRNAMNVNGGDVDNATGMDYVMHFLTFGWKIIFAFIPPPSIWGGWLAFVVALGMIGLLTAIVGDLASIFGCLIGLKDPVTAITFVALGTSLPDLFASKQAAMQEQYADSAIGNITGSNSVNVFLGLGLPWTIAAIYWTAKGETFYVEAGSLGFSVILFSICAVLCKGLIVLRRYVPFSGKGELGGPMGFKIFTGIFMVVLWFAYVLLSSLEVYQYIQVKI